MMTGYGESNQPWWNNPFVILPLILFMGFVLAQPTIPMDDAFISFVYARNLTDHGQIVYNVNEHPVEGYTNFLWVAGGSVLGVLGFQIPWALQWASLGLGALVVLGAMMLAGRIRKGGPKSLIFLTGILLVTNPSFIYWTIHAMAGNLVLALLMAALLLYFRALEGKTTWVKVGGALFLLALARFDALLLSGLLIGADFAYNVKEKKPQHWRMMAAFAIPYALYTLWRVSYYGELLPNTFYAKVGGLDDVILERGITYVIGCLEEGFLWLPAAILTLIGVIWLFVRRHAEREIFVVTVIAGLWSAYVLIIGGDNLRHYRFMLPALVLIYALLPRILADLLALRPAERIAAALRSGVVQFIAGMVIVGVLVIAAKPYAVITSGQTRTDYGRAIVGRIFAGNTHPDTRIALIAAGIMKYYAERPVLDMMGLNEYTIARADMGGERGAPGHEKYDSEYVFEQRPEIIYIPMPTNIESYGDLRWWARDKTKTWASHKAIMDLVIRQDIREFYKLGRLRGYGREIAFFFHADVSAEEIFNEAGLQKLTIPSKW